MLITHGVFTPYTPVRPEVPETEADRRLQARIDANGLFLRTPEGLDWYAAVADLGVTGRQFVGIVDGRVVTVSSDPSAMFPIDMLVVETDEPVTIGWGWVEGSLVAPSLLAPSVSDVKLEAGRRILSVLPMWKQMNMTARQSELSRIQVGQMRAPDGGLLPARSLTTDEIAEETAIAAAWAWVKAIRQTSDALEQTRPVDFADDVHWPAFTV